MQKDSNLEVLLSSFGLPPSLNKGQLFLPVGRWVVCYQWGLPRLGSISSCPGACLDTSAAGGIYEDPGQSSHIKRMRHAFIVSNWWYFEDYYSLPFEETVGVGQNAYQVCFQTHEEIKMFLLSEESLLLYANSQINIASLANLFNFSVHIFTYNVQSWDMYGNRAPNRWTTTTPDPLLSSFNPITPGEVADLVLYNEDTVHYDLLVREDSRLAQQGTVPMRIEWIKKNSLPTFSPPSSLSIDCSPQPPSAAAVRMGLLQSQGISPMNFPACPRGRGRPKLNERQGASKIKRKAAVLDEDESTQTSLIPAPKKRGRPKGSKNKEKDQVSVSQPVRSQRELAESAAEESTESSFIDSGDICLVCNFAFNDPIKRGKLITKCLVCKKKVHKPCLEKSGCTCQLIL